MNLAVSQNAESLFPESTREKLLQSKRQLRCEIFEFTREKNDDLFVLFYAFYKDDAYSRRLTIATYAEMLKEFEPRRNTSVFFVAYERTIPLGMLWASQENDTLLLHYAGCIQKGYEHHADLFLFNAAVIYAREHQLQTVSYPKKTLFHGMMSL